MRETSWEAGRLQVVRRYLTEMSETIKREGEGGHRSGIKNNRDRKNERTAKRVKTERERATRERGLSITRHNA